jgi:ABC-type transporter Mla subunit MlaD
MQKVKAYLVCVLLSVAAAAIAGVGWEAFSTLRQLRAKIETAAPSIQRTAEQVEQITAMARDTAAAVRPHVEEAAGKLPATMAAIQATAESANKTGMLLQDAVREGTPKVQTALESAAQAATLLGDCRKAPKTCIEPRLAGLMRSAELAAGNSYKVTREAARVAPQTADAAEATVRNAAVVSRAAADHAEPIAQSIESVSKDAATIAHHAANPFAYLRDLIRGLFHHKRRP